MTENIQRLIGQSGVEQIELQNAGKSRLAYPIRHVRYGYFVIYQFAAAAAAAKSIIEQVRLSGQCLRALMRKTAVGAPKFERLTPIADVLMRDHDERTETEMAAPVTAEAAAHQIRAREPEPVAATPAIKTETKAEDIKLDDIEKKLDEILGSDISNV